MYKIADFFLCSVFLLFVLSAAFGVLNIDEYPEWYKRVIVISTGFAVFCGATFFLSRENRINISIFICSVGLCLFLVNLTLMLTKVSRYIRDKHYTELRIEAAAEAGVEFDTRNKLEVVKDLRSKGLRTYPSYHSLVGLDRTGAILPLGGVANVTTVLDNENGKYVVYKSDRYGFNNDDGIYDPPRGIELLIVGDSFAHGQSVQPGEDTASVLRSLGVNAATIGIGGNGALFHLMGLIEYGKVFKPKVVIWFHSRNDLPDMLREVGNEILRRYYSDSDFSQNLINRQSEVDNYVIDAIDEVQRDLERNNIQQISGQLNVEKGKRKSRPWMDFVRDSITLFEIRHLLGLRKDVYNNDEIQIMKIRQKKIDMHLEKMAHIHNLLALPEPKNYVYENLKLAKKDQNGEVDYFFRLPDKTPNTEVIFLFYKSILERAQNIANLWGGKLYIVYLPSHPDYAVEPPKYRDELFSTIKELKIQIIDFGDKLEENGDPLAYFPWRLGGHYNATGYALLAQQIIDEVQELAHMY